MVRDIENFALGQLKQMYDKCLYLLCNAYACKRTQKACKDGVLIDWKFEPNKKAWKELQRLECGFKEYDEPIHITRSKYVALFEGKPDARLYDEIADNVEECQREATLQRYVERLVHWFDSCIIKLKGFYEWVERLEKGVVKEDCEVLDMWDRLNYCIKQFKANMDDIAKRYGITINANNGSNHKVKNDFKTYILTEDKEKTLSILHRAIDPFMKSTDRGTKKEAVGYIRAAIAMGWLSSTISHATFCKEFGTMGNAFTRYMELDILRSPEKDCWESNIYKLREYEAKLKNI